MLPKLAIPSFTCKLPSDGSEVSFRPLLVSEEKILLMAKEAGDPGSQIEAIKTVISACVDGVNVAKLPYFDIEFLFLNLRAKSIGEEVRFTYRHRDGKNKNGDACNVGTEVLINIEDVKMSAQDQSMKFMINDKYGLKMRYPSINDVKKMVENKNDEVELMASCIEYVYDATEIYTPENVQESVRFIKQMVGKEYQKMTKWFESMPSLKHSVNYKCSGCGQEEEIKFEGVSDFF